MKFEKVQKEKNISEIKPVEQKPKFTDEQKEFMRLNNYDEYLRQFGK